MATKMNDEFMNSVINEEAWKKLSIEFQWTEALLEKYQNKIDWNELSKNTNIRWTVPMIQKFICKINWSIFSKNASENVLIPKIIDMFMDKWDWHELSDNRFLRLTHEFLTKYADNIDWGRIINRDCFYDIYVVFQKSGIEFYERYKEYIPASKLQDSTLWEEMVNQRKNKFEQEIIG
jgi:hypothetical protein